METERTPMEDPAHAQEQAQTYTARQVHVVLLLLGAEKISEEEIEQWSDRQRTEVFRWAGLLHLAASDNDDVQVPPMPDFLPANLLEWKP